MYKIIRQKRKSIGIYINEISEIIVKVPYHVSDKEIENIVEQNREWIKKKKSDQEKLRMQKDWIANRKWMYLGKPMSIEIVKTTGGEYVEFEQDTIKLYIRRIEDMDRIRSVLQKEVKRRAEVLFEQLSNKYSEQIGVNYHKITVRNQKTRWGSCSIRGNLSYNIKLMCVPMACIEYVVLHEVMHLKHFNHSQVFWQEIESIMPDYKTYKEYLKINAEMVTI